MSTARRGWRGDEPELDAEEDDQAQDAGGAEEVEVTLT